MASDSIRVMLLDKDCSISYSDREILEHVLMDDYNANDPMYTVQVINGHGILHCVFASKSETSMAEVAEGQREQQANGVYDDSTGEPELVAEAASSRFRPCEDPEIGISRKAAQHKPVSEHTSVEIDKEPITVEGSSDWRILGVDVRSSTPNADSLESIAHHLHLDMIDPQKELNESREKSHELQAPVAQFRGEDVDIELTVKETLQKPIPEHTSVEVDNEPIPEEGQHKRKGDVNETTGAVPPPSNMVGNDERKLKILEEKRKWVYDMYVVALIAPHSEQDLRERLEESKNCRNCLLKFKEIYNFNFKWRDIAVYKVDDVKGALKETGVRDAYGKVVIYFGHGCEGRKDEPHGLVLKERKWGKEEVFSVDEFILFWRSNIASNGPTVRNELFLTQCYAHPKLGNSDKYKPTGTGKGVKSEVYYFTDAQNPKTRSVVDPKSNEYVHEELQLFIGALASKYVKELGICERQANASEFYLDFAENGYASSDSN